MLFLHFARYNKNNCIFANGLIKYCCILLFTNMNSNGNKKRVLIVDDHPQVLAFIQIDLKLRGYDVISASSGEEALKKIKTEKPDVILLDILMPGMSGFDVLQTLRPSNKVPVIAFSASPENQAPAMHAGANLFIAKPFDPDEVAKKIGELVGPSTGN